MPRAHTSESDTMAPVFVLIVIIVASYAGVILGAGLAGGLGLFLGGALAFTGSTAAVLALFHRFG